jgi:hypothetical protein
MCPRPSAPPSLQGLEAPGQIWLPKTLRRMGVGAGRGLVPVVGVGGLITLSGVGAFHTPCTHVGRVLHERDRGVQARRRTARTAHHTELQPRSSRRRFHTKWRGRLRERKGGHSVTAQLHRRRRLGKVLLARSWQSAPSVGSECRGLRTPMRCASPVAATLAAVTNRLVSRLDGPVRRRVSR